MKSSGEPTFGVHVSRFVILILALLLLLAAALFGIGWVFSSRVIVPAEYSLMPEFEIVAVEEGVSAAGAAYAVTLPLITDPNQHADTEVSGVYGLLWEGGYGRLAEVLSADAETAEIGQAAEATEVATAESAATTETSAPTITRELREVIGSAPVAGAAARIDNFVYRRDPLVDFGIPFEELTLLGESGPLRAWYVPGDGRTAVLLLHGRRRGELIETLRMIEPLHELGFDVLALAYRNHDASAASSDGLFHYGADEWRDAHVAARELAARGADRLVLYGLSMGGAVALEALEHWTADLPEPLGAILDSPLVDPYATVELGAVKAGLPLPRQLTNLALLVAGWRTGVDFADLRQVKSAAAIAVPVMVIAGVEDTTVPIASVDAFTAAVRTPLTYIRLDGVEHVEAWNHDPLAYRDHLRAFMASLEVRAVR